MIFQKQKGRDNAANAKMEMNDMQIVEILSKVIGLIYFFWLSWEDQKSQMINVFVIAAATAIGVALNQISQQISLKDMAFGSLIGLGSLLIAFVSRQAIGYGDALLMISVGLIFGLSAAMMIIVSGLFSACIFSVVQILRKRKKKADRIIFVPFLFWGYILFLGAGI